MDRALWISWYDLPDNGRDAYLKWAHGTYIPSMIRRPGFLWGAHFQSEAAVPMSGVPLRATMSRKPAPGGMVMGA